MENSSSNNQPIGNGNDSITHNEQIETIKESVN